MLTALLALALQAPAPQPPATPEKPKAEKKICRRDAATGSIMTMRTCRTQSEWSQVDSAAADVTAEALRQRANAGTSMTSTRDGN
ncbi:hypothetical protein QLH51_13860 [Sphingomonas sp. 2R-10]|uniref:hypothetical protein n=1 Tax=Sphingomonas sp. 2R-10 TaxID=3045148 RepID=UPI000F76D4F9|nr:hypothetical protein [Sphingomonas sp. 2R-10]MDJ0277885.1 hypothetical protein [Sphingomonas sp. 2R-10]